MRNAHARRSAAVAVAAATTAAATAATATIAAAIFTVIELGRERGVDAGVLTRSRRGRHETIMIDTGIFFNIVTVKIIINGDIVVVVVVVVCDKRSDCRSQRRRRIGRDRWVNTRRSASFALKCSVG